MRRVHYALGHGLAMPEPDPMLNYPEGSFSQWGRSFDLLAALWVRASGAAGKSAQERAAAWFPAVLGALCAVAAFFLGSFLVAPWQKADLKTGPARAPPPAAGYPAAGWLTALLVAILPGHGDYTLLGHLDHHVMESLLFAATAACLAKWRMTAGPGRIWCAAATLGLALIYELHPVMANLYGGVFWAICLAQWRPGQRNRPYWAPFLIVGALMLAPAFLALRGEAVGLQVTGALPKGLLMLRYSFFQPAALFFFGLTLLLAERLGARIGGAQRLAPDWRDGLLAAAALACAAAMLRPFLVGSSILFGTHHLGTFNSENMRILFCGPTGGFDPGYAHRMFGWLFLAFPVWWIWQVRRRERDAFLLAFTAAAFILVMFQVRFIYLFSFAFALAGASTLLWVWSRRQAWGGGAWWALAALALSFIPCAEWWNDLAKASPYKYLSVSDDLYECAQWLHDRAPATEGFEDISRRPAWSVLSQMDQGHALAYIGEKAVVADPFGHGMETSARYYASPTPQEALRILDEKKVRYVVARDLSQPGWQSLYATFLGLPPEHPLSQGRWWQLFQMRLLLNLPIPGPDGHPFRWGHRLAFLSSTGREAIIEYDAAAVKGFKKRAWNDGAGAAAKVAGRFVTRAQASSLAAIESCLGSPTDSFEAFLLLMKAEIGRAHV
jgi:hypothetical protein